MGSMPYGPTGANSGKPFASGSYFNAFQGCNGIDVLVATAGQANDQSLVARHLRCELRRIGDGMAAFQRRDNAFGTNQQPESRQRFLIGGTDILRSAAVF